MWKVWGALKPPPPKRGFQVVVTQVRLPKRGFQVVRTWAGVAFKLVVFFKDFGSKANTKSVSMMAQDSPRWFQDGSKIGSR